MMVSHMLNLTIVLAEAAVVRDGFLDLTAAGWHVTRPEFRTGAVGLIIEVPWDEADGKSHNIAVSLVKRMPQGDEDIDEEPL